MTSTTAAVAGSSRRDITVLSNHSLTRRRSASEAASIGLIGSSMTTRSPPRPVSVPPTEVA